jgi:hypothetical protein
MFWRTKEVVCSQEFVIPYYFKVFSRLEPEARANIAKDFPQAQVYCLCRERMRRMQGRVQIVPWQEGLLEIFLSLDYRVGN